MAAAGENLLAELLVSCPLSVLGHCRLMRAPGPAGARVAVMESRQALAMREWTCPWWRRPLA